MERVTAHERQVASEARAMTRLEVIGKALSGSINWIEAAVVLGVTARHMRRLRLQYEIFGKEGLLDGRRGLPRRRRVSDATISEVLRLRRELYADFSIRHLYEHLVERHGIGVSYTFVRDLLQLRGLADKGHGCGRYLRKRERRRAPGAGRRAERASAALQGRLPHELRLHGVTNYPAANRYREQTFIGDFNRRFTVRPRERGSAFSALTGIDLELVVSAQHERIVQKDNTVVFERLFLQLAPSPERMHYARCPVVVHELVDDTLAVSFQGKLIGRFDRQGTTLAPQHKRKVA